MRNIIRLIFGLFLFGNAVAVTAASYKMEFRTLEGGNKDSILPYYGLVSPGDLLADITFEVDPPFVDDPETFGASFDDFGFTGGGRITEVNLYGWGVASAPDDYPSISGTPSSPFRYSANFADYRNCSTCSEGLDAGSFFIEFLSLPDPSIPRPSDPNVPVPLQLFGLQTQLQSFVGGDILIMNIGSVFPGGSGLYVSGDWTYERINPIPIPATVWLFGTALIGLVGFSERRKAA